MGTTTRTRTLLRTRTVLRTVSRTAAAVATGALALGLLTACGGDDDEPVVTVSPSISPSPASESPTPATDPPTGATPTPGTATPVPLPTPVTTDKPTDRQTIPPQS